MQVKARKWGNSVGITIPKEIVEEEGIRPGDELEVKVNKKQEKARIKALFGKLKTDIPTQELKDEMKTGW